MLRQTKFFSEHVIFTTIRVFTEVALLSLALIVTAIALRSLIKNKRYHINLRILFINHLICNALMIILRLLSLLHTYSVASIISTRLHIIFANTRNGLFEFCSVNLIMILSERLHSTVKAAKYENYFSFKIAAVRMILPWILTFFFVMCFQFALIDMVIMIGLVFAFEFLTLLCCFILWHINKRMMHEYSLDTTLSCRFQIQENINTMQFIAFYCLTYSTFVLLAVVPTSILLTMNVDKLDIYSFFVWIGIFDNLAAFNCLWSSLIFIIPFKKLLHWKSSRIQFTNIADVQREIYFEQLRKQWT